MFKAFRQKLAKLIAPPVKAQTRQYAIAKQSRLTAGWGNQITSEDAELSSSLRTARARSRQLVRDAAYAKRAKNIVQNNVVGSGIGMQAQVMTSRKTLNDRVNDDIEAVWKQWCSASSCHTGGSLHFSDLERVCIGEIFETGEIFLRKHRRAFGDSKVPFALEVIEPERIADEVQPNALMNSAVRLGIEVDQFYRPVAYLIRTSHPGDMRLTAEQTTQIERVPASDILHLRIIDRWPQTRAIPWMHAAARKLNDMDGLTEAEITAARAAACYMGFIQPPAEDVSSFGTEQENGSVQDELEPAVMHKLLPGETFKEFAPNRPNSQLDPFMRMMLREVAAGVGCSYESLSRDYSQSNYSSSRLALLDDRDLWLFLQCWFIRGLRHLIHKEWLQQAVLSRAVTAVAIDEYALAPEKFEAVRFKPRGWSWIDPTKEVEAYKEAIRCGFTTVSDVIAKTANGRDIEDILNERRMELDMMESKGLMFETDPAADAKLNPQPTVAALKKNDGEESEPEEPEDDPTVKKAEKLLREQSRRGVTHG